MSASTWSLKAESKALSKTGITVSRCTIWPVPVSWCFLFFFTQFTFLYELNERNHNNDLLEMFKKHKYIVTGARYFFFLKKKNSKYNSMFLCWIVADAVWILFLINLIHFVGNSGMLKFYTLGVLFCCRRRCPFFFCSIFFRMAGIEIFL